jgi:tetratricopeptide (TPR) repeat protein
VGTPLLIEFYRALPEPREGDDPVKAAARLEKGLTKFHKQVGERYTEGTLQRLLDSPTTDARRAATLALGMFGTMKSVPALAARLHDDDEMVHGLAADALWSIWFRADSEENNKELQRLMRLRDADKAVAGLTELIKKAPDFAEVYNQRAIRYYQAKDYEKSIADCEKVLQLNPQHFGAQSGMAQSYLNLRKPKAALKAYRDAYQINPNLDGVEDAIRALENALGEEGKEGRK